MARIEKLQDPAHYLCGCADNEIIKIHADEANDFMLELVSDTEIKIIKRT